MKSHKCTMCGKTYQHYNDLESAHKYRTPKGQTGHGAAQNL